MVGISLYIIIYNAYTFFFKKKHFYILAGSNVIMCKFYSNIQLFFHTYEEGHDIDVLTLWIII